MTEIRYSIHESLIRPLSADGVDFAFQVDLRWRLRFMPVTLKAGESYCMTFARRALRSLQ